MPIPPHHILGVSSQASDQDIRTAYKELIKKWHPDKYPGNKEYASEQFKRILDAYETMVQPTSTTNSTNPRPNPQGRTRYPPPHQTASAFRQPFQSNHPFQSTQPFPSAQPFPSSQPHQAYSPRVFAPRQPRAVSTNTFSRPNSGCCSSTGCQGGPVLFSGNFHPSQMSFAMLQQLRQSRGT